jgi:AraC family L-rhamnose operon regulatory protein RhaS
MPSPIPIYTAHDEKYRADSCRPLLTAAGKTLRLAALQHGHYPGNALPAGALAGVKMVGFWDAQRDQEWGLEWHRNEGIELAFLETGHLEFGADQCEYDLRAGDLTITRPWQLHRVGHPVVTASRLHWLIIDLGVRRPDQPWRWPPWVLLTPADKEEITNLMSLNEQPVLKANGDIRRCFKGIAHAIETDQNGSSVSRLTSRLNDLFVSLLDVLRSRPVQYDHSLTSTSRSVQLFLDDLSAHPEHLALEWTVEEMAQSCGLGVSQFSHHVKCLVNLTPMQYLCKCRIDRAATILAAAPASRITDTALNLGFSSSQYFATVFRRRFGYSPRSLRLRAGTEARKD